MTEAKGRVPQPLKIPLPMTNRVKGLLALLWLGLVSGGLWLGAQQGVTPESAVAGLRASEVGPLLFVLLYTLRPLTLLSAGLFTLAAGYLFGPVWGPLYAIVGSNAGALLAYGLGALFGHGWGVEGQRWARLGPHVARLRRNSFEGVLLMRLLLLPYDGVNFLCGVLRVGWQPFLLGSTLGSLAGTVAVALLGASVQGEFRVGAPSVNPWAFAASLGIFALSLTLSRTARRREAQALAHES